MAPGSSTTVRRALAAAVVALTGLAVWAGLGRVNPRAPWLAVEAPDRAVADRPFPITVRVRHQGPPMYLVVDLHWTDRAHQPRGFLSQGGRVLLPGGRGSYTFTAPVPGREDLGFVLAIIYLTPSGDWRDREREARTDLVPVRVAGGTPQGVRWTQLPTYENEVPGAAGRPLRVQPAPEADRSAGRGALGALLLVSGLLAVWSAAAAGRGSPERSAWAVLAAAYAAASVWELLGLAADATQLGRTIASQHNWYYLRKPFQAALIAVLAATGAAIAMLLQRLRRSRRLRWTISAAVLYALLSAVDLLSFHATDAIAAISVAGLPLIQLLKAASVVAALPAVAPRRRP